MRRYTNAKFKNRTLVAMVLIVLSLLFCIAVFGNTEKESKGAEATKAYLEEYENKNVFDVYTQKYFDDIILYLGKKSFENKTINLHTDIRLKKFATSPFSATENNGNFMGQFNGNGKTIFDLSEQPLFLQIGNLASVENLSMMNFSGSRSALSNANFGEIENVHIQGTVNLLSGNFGGMVNLNAGLIKNSTVSIDFKSNPLAFESTNYVGGVFYAQVNQVVSEVQFLGRTENVYFNGEMTDTKYQFATIGFNFVVNTDGEFNILETVSGDGGKVENIPENFGLAKGKDTKLTVSNIMQYKIVQENGLSSYLTNDINAYLMPKTQLPTFSSNIDFCGYVLTNLPYAYQEMPIQKTDLNYSSQTFETPAEVSPIKGSGTASDPYLVSNINQLFFVKAHPDLHYQLISDIYFMPFGDDPEYYQFQIENFSGKLNGNGYSLIGLTAPLFKSIITNGEVTNLKVRAYERGDNEALNDLSFVELNYGKISLIECNINLVIKNDFTPQNSQTIFGRIQNCYAKTIMHNISGNIFTSAESAKEGKRIIHTTAGVVTLSKIYVPQFYVGFDFEKVWEFDSFNNLKLKTFKDVKTAKKVVNYSRLVPQPDVNFGDFTQKTARFLTEALYFPITFDIDSLTSWKWTFKPLDNELATAVDLTADDIIYKTGIYAFTSHFEGDDETMPFEFNFSFKIKKINVEYTFNDIKGVGSNAYYYDGRTISVTDLIVADNSLGKILTYTFNVTLNGARVVQFLNAGIYDVSVTVSAENYNNYTHTFALQISRRQLDITLRNDINTEYKKLPIITVNNLAFGNLVDGEVADTVLTLSKLKILSSGYSIDSVVGRYAFTIGEEQNNYATQNYYINCKNSKFVIVNKADIDINGIEISNKRVEYDGKLHSILANIPEGKNLSVRYDGNGIKNVNGNGSLVKAIFFINDNYVEKTLTATLEITAKSLRLTVDRLEIAYNTAVPKYTATASGLAENETLASINAEVLFSCTYQKGSSVGNYKISIAGTNGLSNYLVSLEDGSLVVNAIALSFEIDKVRFTYDGVSKMPTFLFGNGLSQSAVAKTVEYSQKNDKGEFVSMNGEVPLNAGEYKFYAKLSALPNYKEMPCDGTLIIDKAEISNTILSSIALRYNKQNITIDYGSINAEWSVAFRVDNIAYDTINITDVGEYLVEIIISPNKNYLVKTLRTVVTINPISININRIAAKVFNGKSQAPDIFITNNSVVLGDDEIKFLVNYQGKTPMSVDRYSVDITSGNKNYAITDSSQKNQSFDIVRATVEIDVSSKSKVLTYGDSFSYNERFTFSYNNIEFTEEIKMNFNKVPLEVGTYSIASANNNKNFQFVIKNGEQFLKINPKVLAFSKKGIEELQYNATIQNPYTFEITGGLLYEDKALILVDGTDRKNVGIHEIKLSVNNKNYCLNDAESVVSFEITKANLTITADDKFVKFGNKLPDFTYVVTGLLLDDTEMSTIGQSVIRATNYNDGDDVGAYTIVLSGATADNYNISYNQAVLDVQNGTLIDVKAEKSSAIYSGNVVLPIVTDNENCDAITFSSRNINVGTFPVAVTFSKKNYDVKIIDTNVQINQAPIQLTLTPCEIIFDIDVMLHGGMIDGYAMSGEIPVDGAFVFVNSNQNVLKFGENIYQIRFYPLSSNFSDMTAEYTIKGIYPPDDVVVNMPEIKIENDKKIIYGNSSVVIKFPLQQSENVVFFVNGKQVLGDKITFEKSAKNVLIEAKIGGNLIFSQLIDNIVVIDSDNAKITWIVIGSCAGGLAVVIFVVFVILKRKN